MLRLVFYPVKDTNSKVLIISTYVVHGSVSAKRNLILTLDTDMTYFSDLVSARGDKISIIITIT